MAAILLVGHVTQLLRQREQALLRAGHDVVAIRVSSGKVRDVVQRDFDVVIIGHAVPERQRHWLVESIKSRSPETAIVLFYRGSIRRAELADAILNADGNHKDLLSTVEHLLSRQCEQRARRTSA